MNTAFNITESRKPEAAVLAIKSKMAALIVKAINDQGLTQTEAAQKANVSQPRVSRLKSGAIDTFSIDALIKIAVNLDLKIDAAFDPDTGVTLAIGGK